MPFESWQAFYASDLQGVWALLVAPLAFAVARLVAAPQPLEGAEGRFVERWTWAFLAVAAVDPLATGPLAKAIGSEAAASALALAFVLAGDFRVYWLVLHVGEEGVSARRSAGRALLWTAAVPLFAGATTRLAARVTGEPLPGQGLWIVHELAFLVVAAALARRWVPRRVRDASRRRRLRAVLAFVAVYYALWAAADALLLAGVEAGWGVRAVPNQLYYGLFVPFVWWRFAADAKAETSTSTQAER